LVEAVGSKGDVQIDPHDIKEQHLLSLGHSLSLLHSMTHRSFVGIVNSGHIPRFSPSAF